jgi:6-pyruvoyltetrahydropterin/6-carboxytetrahydropterin synthase
MSKKAAKVVNIATITKRYEWDMAHRIPNHAGKCARLHGHRYVAEIDITGPLVDVAGASDEGMVIDFYALKQVLEANFGDWDHRCMIYRGDQSFLGIATDKAKVMGIFLVPYIPTAENIARDMMTKINEGLPVRVLCTRVRVYETPNGWAEVK